MGPIIHVVQHLQPGGLEVLALELARAQAADRTRPVLVVSLEGEKAETLRAWPRLLPQEHQLVFMCKRPGIDATLPARLLRLFRRLRPSAVHTHHIGPLLYAGPAARAAGVPCRIHTEHDAWHLQNAKRRRIARLALALTDPILVADAPHVAAAVTSALGCPSPRVILNGVDTTRFIPGDRDAARAALDLPLDAAIIGVAARLEAVKGVDIAIAAIAMVPNAFLAIAGSGSQLSNLRAQAELMGIADRVRFVGHIDDMAVFYRALDALCLPSRAEGLPLALLEAQASGTRVVAARVGGVPAAVDAMTGMLVDAEDPQALAQALRNVLHDPATCETSATDRHSPRSFVEKTASLTAMASAYSNLIPGAV